MEKRFPRVLASDIGSFKAGDVITDGFIAKLKGKALQEEAHQLNRRTEFKVLRSDYVKPGTENTPPKQPERVATEENNAIQQVPLEDKSDSGLVESPASNEPGKIHVVEKGDTYQKVAKRYGITQQELKKINNLKSEPIYEGMELKVEANGNYTEYDKKFYELQKEDKSWSSVAKKLGMKSGDLKKLNPNVDDSSFREGMKIRKEK
jgi:LysM repeat protein